MSGANGFLPAAAECSQAAPASQPEARSALLDMHGGISDAERPEGGCERSRRLYPNLRLHSSRGQTVRARCRATNRCDYCAKMEAVEFAEALALDALAGSAPTFYVVLTTREATHDTRPFYESRRQVQRAVRRRWPAAEFVWVVEFTTGRAGTSGGRRRPHWNGLVKNVPPEALDEFSAVVRSVWCSREDAEPWAQYVGAVEHVGGLMKYLGLHFFKVTQRPPKGWSGHRTMATRGYFGKPMRVVREEARASLRSKRALHRALEAGYDGEEAEVVAAADVHRAEQTTWEAAVYSEKVVTRGGAGRVPGEVVPRLRRLDGGELHRLRSDEGKRRRFEQEENYGRSLRELDARAEGYREGVGLAGPPPSQGTTAAERILGLAIDFPSPSD